ncbi:oxidoreductase, aldo/keto reductase family protein [Oesophagostomum dentatum]|uniref:Oxidoreductase, aldo/keto reductase family protein n=1 Tax=Oesophagostomum dentatum TaxID=61180 RepID=A0A0B1T1S5_OESDE|nr:oxidoreductase, aldo/keto reductase family protein [Oesophagostomum dentatum]
MDAEVIKLSTGASMPILGLGTWLSSDEDELTVALKAALDDGYRLIDTAFIYRNERVIGNVLREYFDSGRLKRSDIFITSKLPYTAHAPEDVEKCANTQLEALQLDYIDLYLMHCPVPVKREKNSFEPAFVNDMQIPVRIAHLDTWHAMEKLYDKGKVKALGLSNFNAKQLRNVYDHARVKPANLQVHQFIFDTYAPLGAHGRKEWSPHMEWPECDSLTEPLVKDIAARHNKTTAQVLLRHLIQRGMAVIPKSIDPKRIKENTNVFDFSLSEEEMEELKSVECHLYWPQAELLQLCKKLNISFTAYAPLGAHGRKEWSPHMEWPECDSLTEPLVKDIAARHNKTTAQVLLRHLIQRGMAVIPKSIDPKRIKENTNVFDFSLSEEEMEELKSVKRRTRLFVWDIAIGHPFYPFDDVDQAQFRMTSMKA